MTKLISINEVRKHQNKESCWIVIHNDVYDVTSYLEEHPGGEEALLDAGGKDGTQDFEDVGHSDDARELMKKFKIGTLPPEEIKNIRPDVYHPGFETTTISVYSCEHIPKIEKQEKTWRTYDGSSGSRPVVEPKSVYKTPSTPKIERRVQSIIVPKERRRGPPCESGGSSLKWAVLALAGALVIGLVLKKYLAA